MSPSDSDEVVVESPAGAAVAYIRRPMPDGSQAGSGCHDDRSALVLLNFSREPIEVRLPANPAITNTLLDGMTGKPVVISDNQISLTPSSARVLASGDSPCGNVMSAR